MMVCDKPKKELKLKLMKLKFINKFIKFNFNCLFLFKKDIFVMINY